MKSSKVTNVQGNGTFKDMHVFEVELENGDMGKIYKKSREAGIDVGQELEYTMNEKGTIKIVTEYQKNLAAGSVSSNGVTNTYKKDDNVQQLIVKQSSLKAAVDFCDDTSTVKDVIKVAQEFVDWVMDNKVPIENNSGLNGTDDLPF
mgnify:FL=1